MSDDLEVKLQFRCPKGLERALQQRAARERRTLSNLIRVLLEAALNSK